jgi:hypothetical protein
MAEVNKISSFKSFSEIKAQESAMKLREENNLKRQETLTKIEEILDEMGVSSISDIDEDTKTALINKLFANVSEDEAEDIEDEILKMGTPKKLEEGNAFIYAAAKARQDGKEEFEFNGKTYKVTLKKDTGLKEGNAFGDAVKKAKEAGETEFEFDGETYKVEEHLDEAISRSAYDRMDGLHNTKAMDSLLDSAKTIFDDLTEEMFEFDEICDFIVMKIKKSKLAKMYESMVAEGKHGMAKKLLQSLIKGETSSMEGIKMSKELADHYLNWINTSPFGKKNENLPLYMLVKASFNWGIERGLDSKLKGELEALKSSIKESVDVESIDEARSINKIQYDWSKLTTTMAATAQNWKAAEGAAKEMLLGKLKEMTAQKKALEAELDAAVAGKDKDLELVVKESIVTEGAVKQFEADFNDMVKNIKSGYGWIDPEFVADTWENSSDSIDFELVKGEIYKRLIKAGLLWTSEDGEEKDKQIKSLKELGIKESAVTEAKDDFMARHSGTDIWLKKGYKNHSEEELQALYFKIGEVVKDNLDVKQVTVVFESETNEAEISEAEIKSDDEFKEYAMTVLKDAFKDDFDEAKANDVINGILGKVDGDYGAAVGMLTSSLGESVVTEGFDANYWEDYHESAGKIENPNNMQIQQEVEATAEEWNDNNEDGPDNEITSKIEKKVIELAKKFVKAKGWISTDVIEAMLSQEA